MSEPMVVSRKVRNAQKDLTCDWCEGTIAEGRVYVRIEAVLDGFAYSLNYHYGCDQRAHTDPPRGWDNCLKEEK